VQAARHFWQSRCERIVGYRKLSGFHGGISLSACRKLSPRLAATLDGKNNLETTIVHDHPRFRSNELLLVGHYPEIPNLSLLEMHSLFFL
jgi:hypothetical protein